MWTPICLFTVLLAKSSANIYTPSPQEVKDAFRIYRIAPEVIPVAPEAGLTGILDNCQLKLGNLIAPWCTTIMPYITWPNANANVLYTLIAIDPDFPQYFTANDTQFLHSLTVNIPGLNIEEGDTLSPYVPCAPFAGSGYHRYIYLVYKQQSPIAVTNELLVSISKVLTTFSISEFLSCYNLGNPIAGNFFRSGQTLCEPRPNEETDDCCGTKNHQCDSKCTAKCAPKTSCLD